METLTISLPESIKEFIDAQVAEGAYESAEEFISALVREEQKRKARAKVDALLIEGLNSGEATPMTPQDWEELKLNLRNRLANRDGSES